MRLKDRVALVTGSSRGIGTAIAVRLAADGAKVVLHGRTASDGLMALRNTIRSRGGDAHVVTGDLETEDAPVHIVRDAFAVHGALDILVCNAGGGGSTSPAVGHTATSMNRIIAFNLRAVMLSTGEYARLTKSPHGRVIMISSGSASHPAEGATIYAAAKAGVEAFARSVAQELGPRGITVNSIAPGMTQTDMIKDPRFIQIVRDVASWAALRRIGVPEDIADVVAFFASDDSRWLTGLTIMANGGLITSSSSIMARTVANMQGSSC